MIASCKKDDIESISSPGFFGEYLTNNSQIIVSPISEPNVSPSTTNFGIYRGYYFIPSKDIKITAIGAKIPEKGTYKIIVTSGVLNDFVDSNYMLLDSITINNPSEFQYKNISQALILSASTKYLIAYFNSNNLSVYQAQFPHYISIPLTIKGIKIESLFYCSGTFYNGMYCLEGGNILQGSVNCIYGLVDFKYDVIQ
ncbi:hypothetical protein [Microbacter margulisiae]|uniref:Uncharacterized protein n=1 Tax=Microbacter margulisiae TaxID=1350067 RepID=A0A7W5H1L6_9PORP|nr:hypothetical protein [Microbacter margulisiae]MBB3186739.1 hypothetical protein [Microbacter margulisiae]